MLGAGLTGFLALGLGAYALVVGAMYLLQDALVFPAMPVSDEALATQVRLGGVTVHHPVSEDGTRLLLWHVPREGKRVLVWFHGNGGSITAVPWFAEQLPDWDIVGFSYRGYPGSEGAPSEAGLVQDAEAVWVFVTGELGFEPGQIVLHGQSLGGGVVSHLLARHRPAAAVLDSTFLSVRKVAGDQYPFLPVGALLRHPFRSDERAPRVQTPVLLLHGDRDRVIPVAHGRELAKLYPKAHYHEVPAGGHDMWLLDDAAAFRVWRSFLGEVRPQEGPL